MLHQIQSYLPDNFPWKSLVKYFDTITSTNDVLKEMARAGAPHGTVLVAGHQTGGRGRLGRSFHSPADVGIYLSVLLRPNCGAEQMMHLTCAAAVAACNALEKSSPITPQIKWTNDIVCSKRKIAGILTELGMDSPDKLNYVIIGIGINCNQKTEDFPEDIQSFAGSLSMLSGQETNRALVAANLIKAFADMDVVLLTNQPEIMQEYKAKCITLGQEVSILRGDEVNHGKALDITSDGGLIVQYEDGTVHTVSSGEVSVRGLYHYI